MTMPFPNDAPPTPGLIADVLAGLVRLLRGEVDLAKAEAAAALKSVVRAAALALGAVALAAVGLGLLAQAAVATLIASGLSPAIAALLVAAVMLMGAAVLVTAARQHLRRAGQVHERSARNIVRDLQSLKSGVTSHAAE